MDKLDLFIELVTTESREQNLIAPSTVPHIWARHVVDSAQLLSFAGEDGAWLDVGTGGGFPGIVIAILRDAPILMVEPRGRRATFLRTCVEKLALPHASVQVVKVEKLAFAADVISARAVSSIDSIFTHARQCAGASTKWILPKGRTAEADLAIARQSWQGSFHVEHSVIQSDSGIIVAQKVERR